GKSNLFQGMMFAKNLVVQGTQPDAAIPVNPFRLDDKGPQSPCRFSFHLLADQKVYAFDFAVTRSGVVEESLHEVGSTTDKLIYRRSGEEMLEWGIAKGKERTFLEYTFSGTRRNQLFLTNAVNQKSERFAPIYRWFRDRLVLIDPNSRYEPFESFLEETNPLRPSMNFTLERLDTGIVELDGEEVPFDTLPIPQELKADILERLQEGMTLRVNGSPLLFRFLIQMKDGQPLAKKLVTYHRNAKGEKVKFEFAQESDGTRRAIDLAPAFLELYREDSQTVYFVDELDRSLHTLMTRELLSGFLRQCTENTRSQLIFTTHDVLQMTQALFRRDEMWIAERHRDGSSRLLSFSEYENVRYDKDLRKSYLQGRMGGIPQILEGARVDG
nr:ATP-binding protein [Kiritimatiellia bacterium]